MADKDWDTLIKGGLVIDGTGAKPIIEDVALLDGKVAARGLNLNPASADQVIDATGQWVTPGFLDIHTHLDLEVEIRPGLEEVVRHGTTTVLVSNCSLGLAFGAQRRNGEDPLVDCFARVENIPKHVLSGVADTIDWNDSAAYFEHLDQTPLGPNMIPMIPHSMLRAEVMGLQGSVSREPSKDELNQMTALLEKGMKEGYVGLSTDALPFHYLANDPNRQTRIPSQWCSWGELKKLSDVLRRHDRLWQATPAKDNPLDVLKSFALTSGRLFKQPLRVTAVAVLDFTTNKSVVPMGKILSRILNSKLLRGRFYFQVLAGEFKVFWDGPINPLAEEIPELRALNEIDLDKSEERRALIADPAYREKFRAMWMHGKSGFNLANLARLLNRESMAFTRQLDKMFVTSGGAPDWAGQDMATIQKRLVRWQQTGQGALSAEEADHFGRFPDMAADEVDFILHLFAEYDLGLRWSYASANSDAEVVEELLFDDTFLPGFNDCGAHLTNLAFNDANLVGLQMAQRHGLERVAYHVHRLTRVPADFLNVDAGRMDLGAQADINLIDPDALAGYDSWANTKFIWRDDIENEQLVKRSDGIITHCFIAGQLAWTKDGATPVLGTQKLGRALRARNHTPANQNEAQAALAAE